MRLRESWASKCDTSSKVHRALNSISSSQALRQRDVIVIANIASTELYGMASAVGSSSLAAKSSLLS